MTTCHCEDCEPKARQDAAISGQLRTLTEIASLRSQ
jgi:hypothetical protein